MRSASCGQTNRSVSAVTGGLEHALSIGGRQTWHHAKPATCLYVRCGQMRYAFVFAISLVFYSSRFPRPVQIARRSVRANTIHRKISTIPRSNCQLGSKMASRQTGRVCCAKTQRTRVSDKSRIHWLEFCETHKQDDAIQTYANLRLSLSRRHFFRTISIDGTRQIFIQAAATTAVDE